MVVKVNWTETAKNDYLQIMDYLLESWGKKSAKSFKTIVHQQIQLIVKRPKMYPITEAREGVRRCVLVKQVSMYYLESEKEGEITIIRFYDNRKDSTNLPGILNDDIDQ